jgi:hypothetical protein
VTFESPSLNAALGWYAAQNRRFGARGMTLQSGIGGLTAEELADLLNAYRDPYGHPPQDDPESGPQG